MSQDGRHATLLDAGGLGVVHRFRGRFDPGPTPELGTLHAPDDHHRDVVSNDGWLSKLNLQHLTREAEARRGVETRSAAIAHDGRTLIVANWEPHTLVVLDAETLTPLKVELPPVFRLPRADG